MGDMRAPTVGHIRSPNQKLGAIDPRAPVSDEPCFDVTRHRLLRGKGFCVVSSNVCPLPK